mgnify:CR=1 FL=1
MRLDSFMLDVLIPLAAQTNAIVLCEAIGSECALTAAFTRVVSMKAAKWKPKVPLVAAFSGKPGVAAAWRCYSCAHPPTPPPALLPHGGSVLQAVPGKAGSDNEVRLRS